MPVGSLYIEELSKALQPILVIYNYKNYNDN